MSNEDGKFTAADFTPEENVAFVYIACRLGILPAHVANEAATREAAAGHTEGDIRRAIRIGTAKLAEKGLVTVERDGLGEHVAVKLNIQGLSKAPGLLVTEDGE